MFVEVRRVCRCVRVLFPLNIYTCPSGATILMFSLRESISYAKASHMFSLVSVRWRIVHIHVYH
jgi:hypothetical protein